MTITLAYGKNGLPCDIPEKNLRGVLTMPPSTRLADPAGVLVNALDHPIGSRPLAALAAGARSACVVICDITRPVPNTLILPPLLSRLERSGIPKEHITILIATGLHRPSTDAERLAMMGEEIVRAYRIVDHRAREGAEQDFLGTTRRGTPVWKSVV